MTNEKAQKFSVGDKVRILDAKGISCAVVEGYVNGDVTELIKTPGGNLGIVGKCGCYPVAIHGTEFDYIEKVAEHVTKNQRLSALEQQVAELQAEVATLKQASKPTYKLADTAEVFIDGKSFGKVTAVEARLLSANEQRKAIIAEAKSFVAEYSGIIADNATPLTSEIGDTIVKLHVNEVKRVVTAVPYMVNVRCDCGPHRIKIAKCAPDDVFNADIGKAIALGRALGLDVKRFEQAVKPTKVVVGMVVNVSSRLSGKDGAKVYGVKDGAFGSPGLLVSHFYGNRPDGHTWIKRTYVTQITDDTDAQY